MNSVFKALNDPTRRAILELLKKEDLSAGDIADQFDMTKPSISHHLDILKRADLILANKQGQFIIYSINTTVLEELFQWIYKLKDTTNEIPAKKRTSLLDTDPGTDPLPGV